MKNRPSHSYAFYSGLAFQMAAIIGFFAWGGHSLDAHRGGGKLFTVILSLTGVFIALFLVMRTIIKRNR